MLILVSSFLTAIFSVFAGIFIIGSFGFWALLTLASILIIWALEYEKGTRATLTLVLTISAIIIFNKGFGKLFAWIGSNFLLFAGLILGYFFVGAIWSIVKWYFYTKNRRYQYDKLKIKFFRSKNLQPNTGTIPADLREEWEKYLGSSFEFGSEFIRTTSANAKLNLSPSPYDHKSTILMWMGHWPLSLLWTLINDPVKHALRWMYKHLIKTYEKISNFNFKSVNLDLLTEEERQTLINREVEIIAEERIKKPRY